MTKKEETVKTLQAVSTRKKISDKETAEYESAKQMIQKEIENLQALL